MEVFRWGNEGKAGGLVGLEMVERGDKPAGSRDGCDRGRGGETGQEKPNQPQKICEEC